MFQQFAVPTGHAADGPHRIQMPVSASSVLVPAVSGARLSWWTGPASQTPTSSLEVSTAASNPVAARYLVDSSPWGRHPDQAHLRAVYADLSKPFATSRITASDSRCATPEQSAPSVVLVAAPATLDFVAAGSCRSRPNIGPTLPGQQRAPPSRSLDSVCGATIDSRSLSRSCATCDSLKRLNTLVMREAQYA